MNKSKLVLGNGDRQWEQRIVAELDSALNKWVNSVPAHRAFCCRIPARERELRSASSISRNVNTQVCIIKQKIAILSWRNRQRYATNAERWDEGWQAPDRGLGVGRRSIT